MKYSYYPGCTLKTKARELERFALDSAEKMGITLEEQNEWQCCGAVYPMGRDEIATKLSSVRSLAEARDKGEKLVTLCSACHHVIKRVNEDMRRKTDIREKVNNYLQLDNYYSGEGEVVHLLEVLRDEIGFEELSRRVEKPLKGRKIGAYYGCLLLRPGGEMNFDDPEDPSIIEDFIEALGGEAVRYPYRTECCGGYLITDNREVTEEMTGNIMRSAEAMGVEEIVTACPLCKYNLEERGRAKDMSVVYFTELMAEALGVG
ncbi:heterodisulfide reductase subunit B [Propionigenium maris DSM 9537]|uniref:Heterodisulfide reductase subunit B n=1 Tax=Propionigenium maris DSM 9537 TaxID=1123000 RepID=A0A9W6GQ21_9FUSO|nr:CoB--CoM heterodisulfide reductase iron-sulfur subunit B family protein [Propionigenium maris]GLI58061.1 heterodisulfide reductase subunit B [Propionigenium maris DSM 9537]